MPDHNRSTEVTPAAEALARPDTEIVPAVGEADDWMDFEPVLEKATAKRVFVVAIVGHGRKHDATLAAYQQAARKNAARDKFGKVHVEVVSFDAVTDPEEIALDLITLVS